MKKVCIGIDSHKENSLVAVALAGRGDPDLYGKAPADLDDFVRGLRRILAKYGLEKEDVAICYEAGPTGGVLARRLRALGFECEVVEPSLIPVKASDRVKTDRRDARKNPQRPLRFRSVCLPRSNPRSKSALNREDRRTLPR